ncbi:MAG TPA: hypothetical protein VIR77_05370 [Pontiella sp.]
MLRRIRLLGIIAFAWLVGLGASELIKMYRDGELFDRYNSDRKRNITMLAVSLSALTGLGYYELSRIRIRSRYTFDFNPYRKDEERVQPGQISSSIYDAPVTKEDWDGNELRISNLDEIVRMESPEIWMGWLRACCILVPIIYSVLFTAGLIKYMSSMEAVWILSSVFTLIFVFSIVTAVGVFKKAPWGMNMGFLLAIGNLVVFPYGTIMGLFLITGLVGAKSLFSEEKRIRKKMARRKNRAKRRRKSMKRHSMVR